MRSGIFVVANRRADPSASRGNLLLAAGLTGSAGATTIRAMETRPGTASHLRWPCRT